MPDGDEKAAKNKADDLRPDVLHCGSTMQAKRAGNIAQEAGYAKAHIDRIAQHDQKGSNDANAQSGSQDTPSFFPEIHE